MATPDHPLVATLASEPAYTPRADAQYLARIQELKEEVGSLRQGIWDAYRILGFDTDGDPTPAALVHPPLWDLIRQAATEHRKDYDDALDEIERLRAELD